MRRLLASGIVRLGAIVLPRDARDWGRAMVAELAAIEKPGAALAFALGCLAGALRQTVPSNLLEPSEGKSGMHQKGNPLRHPRGIGALCAIAATGLGLAYMTAAGAPPSYLAVNAAALAIGLLAVGVLAEAGQLWRSDRGAIALLLAGLILLTSLFGVSADGARRWVSIGGIPLQPDLFLVPVIALGFARARDSASLLAVIVTALALAVAPDRAMAGALAAGMTAVALARPERAVLIGLAAALSAFAATLVRPDVSPAVPFVDQVFFSSFGVHPLAGLAVLGGAALMIVPAVAGYVRDPAHRLTYAVFGAVWLAVLLAAALGNYPTPLVGYSGSAIFGYLISLIGLPPRPAVEARPGDDAALRLYPEEDERSLRAGLTPAH